jgi:hypothetical protein
MEVYTLDPLLRRESVIDRFQSLIWTERYNLFGDFELVIYSTLQSRNLLKTGTLLAMNESFYVMRVESVEDATDDTGIRLLSVKGRSLEAILTDRILSLTRWISGTIPDSYNWKYTGPPADAARKMFHDMCVFVPYDVGDVLPFIVEGSFMTESTIPEPIDPITVDLEPAPLYDGLTALSNVWNLGFRILRHYDTSQLYFDIYTGNNRTTAQSDLPSVVFAPELDNLQNTKELATIDQAKNVAYVYSPGGFQTVYPIGVDPDVAGFDRRVLVVNATDITADTPDVDAALLQRGIEELAKNRATQAFDGEINQNSQYKYGRDYFLGDIIEVRNTDGATNDMRVTEQIFASDAQGDRSYPTLTLNSFITTGSWLSWLNNKVWADLGADEFWADQP